MQIETPIDNQIENQSNADIMRQMMAIVEKHFSIHTVANSLTPQLIVNPKSGEPPFVIPLSGQIDDMVELIVNQVFVRAENAIKNCLYQFTHDFNYSLSNEEVTLFKDAFCETLNEESFDQWFKVVMPLLVKRINFRNKHTKGTIHPLKLYEFGYNLRLSEEPFEVDWCFPHDGIDMSEFSDHRAKISESGRIFITSLTELDGTEVDLSNLDDNGADGYPLTDEPIDWCDLKPQQVQLYDFITRNKAKC